MSSVRGQPTLSMHVQLKRLTVNADQQQCQKSEERDWKRVWQHRSWGLHLDTCQLEVFVLFAMLVVDCVAEGSKSKIPKIKVDVEGFFTPRQSEHVNATEIEQNSDRTQRNVHYGGRISKRKEETSHARPRSDRTRHLLQIHGSHWNSSKMKQVGLGRRTTLTNSGAVEQAQQRAKGNGKRSGTQGQGGGATFHGPKRSKRTPGSSKQTSSMSARRTPCGTARTARRTNPAEEKQAQLSRAPLAKCRYGVVL